MELDAVAQWGTLKTMLPLALLAQITYPDAQDVPIRHIAKTVREFLFLITRTPPIRLVNVRLENFTFL